MVMGHGGSRLGSVDGRKAGDMSTFSIMVLMMQHATIGEELEPAPSFGRAALWTEHARDRGHALAALNGGHASTLPTLPFLLYLRADSGAVRCRSPGRHVRLVLRSACTRITMWSSKRWFRCILAACRSRCAATCTTIWLARTPAISLSCPGLTTLPERTARLFWCTPKCSHG